MTATRRGPTCVAVANAPVSYGAFEITVGIDPHVPDTIGLLDAVAGAGYAGVDLGPLGYLGTGAELRGRLSARRLGLAGGFLELPFSEAGAFPAALGALDDLLDVLDDVDHGAHPPKPTLADAGSPDRARLPGRAALDETLGLDGAGWDRFAESLARTAERCRERGYEPTFHHHTATHVEAPWEIERMLECSDVGLCLDTGHLLLGGGDPVTGAREWSARINHVHLKDARRGIIESIVADGAPVMEVWRRRAFCALGDGDIPVDEVLAELERIGYTGWLVVEQDVLPDPAHPQQAAADQLRNREYLTRRGL